MAFLTIISDGERSWGYLIPELNVVGTAPNRDAALTRAREALAWALEDHPYAATITDLNQVDADIRAEVPAHAEILHLEPAPMNPISVQIEQAIARARMTQADLARAMATSRSAVNRMINPFYWGHSLDLLRRVAEATHTQLHVTFDPQSS